MNRPKPPRRDTKRAKTWQRYYSAMAGWHKESADIIAITMPGSSLVRYSHEEATRFREGADQIANKTHPKLLDGTWK